jgi:hypothetical protein
MAQIERDWHRTSRVIFLQLDLFTGCAVGFRALAQASVGRQCVQAGGRSASSDRQRLPLGEGYASGIRFWAKQDFTVGAGIHGRSRACLSPTLRFSTRPERLPDNQRDASLYGD